VVVLAVARQLPALGVGWAGDDYAQLAMLADLYPGHRTGLDLFRFFGRESAELQAHMAFGTAPWWTVDTFHGGVMRPLASAATWLEHAAIPGRPDLAHLHSLLWWAATVTAAGILLRRVLPPAAALVALLVFALDVSSLLPVAWLANRAVLLSATFSFLALAARVRAGPGDGVGARIRETTLWVLAFAAGEYAICGAGFALAHELVARGRPRARAVLLGVAPAAGPLVAYLTLHRALGYGTTGSAVYVDPFGDPRDYAGLAVSRIPRLAAELWASWPANPGELQARLGGIGVALGISAPTVDATLAMTGALVSLVLATAALRFVARRCDPDTVRNACWFGLGSLLALLPVAAAPEHSRLLLVPGLGAAAFVGVFVVTAARAPGPARWAIRGLAGVLALGHLVLEPIEAWHALAHFRDAHAAVARGLQTDDLRALDLAERDVVLLNAEQPTTGIHGMLVLHALGRPVPRSWRVLSMSHRAHVVSRVAARSLELSTVDGPMLADPPEQFFRPADRPLRPGERVEIDGLRATIVAMHGHAPNRVRFDFDRDLDDPSLVFLVHAPDGLHPVPMPPVGGAFPIPRRRG
jgi:hypothetical protein